MKLGELRESENDMRARRREGDVHTSPDKVNSHKHRDNAR